ncbi:MAG: hypothetical protein HY290_10245 [Planctomycetia bacterium]|nr:hypothetical protein [Planctomycetia bacterium]
MSWSSSLTTKQLLAVFAEEIASRSGSVFDVFDDGCRLFARSILPRVEEVRPHDRHQGGVALRGTESQVWVHPYVFRQVCRNGAIMAQALETCHLTGIDEISCDEASESVREAIATCCSDKAFTTAVEQTRSAATIQADLALSILSHLSHFPADRLSDFLAMIFERFTNGRDNSRYGLMNAVTSVARDTRDPELRWRLEELGGGIPAAIAPPRGDFGGRAVYQWDALVR